MDSYTFSKVYLTSWLLKEAKWSQVWPFTTSRDNNFQSFVSQMCNVLRKDIWIYWTVLMAWLKLIIWHHWQFHLALLNHITWLYWTVSPGVTGPYYLTLLDSFTWRYLTVSPDVTWQFHLSLLNLPDSFTLRYWNISPDVTGQQSNYSICNDQLFNLRLFLGMIAINMTNFSMT